MLDLPDLKWNLTPVLDYIKTDPPKVTISALLKERSLLALPIWDGLFESPDTRYLTVP